MHDFLKFKTQEHKVKIVNGEITAFRAKDITRTGARKFFDGKVSSASVVGEVDSGSLLDKCDEHKDVAAKAEAIPRGTEKKQWNVCKRLDLQAAALQAAQEQTKLLRKELPNFVVSGQLTSTRDIVHYQNDLGADLDLRYDQFGTSYEFRIKGSANILDSFHFESSTAGFAEEGLNWQIELLQAFENEVTVAPGRHKVLMTPDYTVMNKIGESLRADNYNEGTALYSGKMGERLFSEKLNVSDLRYDANRGAIGPFDYEGSIAASTTAKLIEGGVIRRLISDLKNEARHGVESTANGFRQYNSSVKLAFSNLAIEPGPRSFREILKDAGDVIVTVMVFGGDLTSQGNYSSPIQLSFLSKGGKIVGRLPALSMSSHIQEMLGSQLLEIASNGAYPQSSSPYYLSEVDIQTI